MRSGDSALLEWARGYSRWLHRCAPILLSTALVVAILGAVLAARLEIRGGFSDLLPPDRRSVQELKAIQNRVTRFGSMVLVVEADDDSTRRDGLEQLCARLRSLDSDLVGAVETSNAEAARFLWDHRFLLVDLEKLERGRDALRDQLARARERANPLYVDLEEEDEKTDERELGRLRQTLEDLEQRRDQALGGYVSRDGRLRLVLLRTTFPASNVSRGDRLVELVRPVIRDVEAAPLTLSGLG